MFMKIHFLELNSDLFIVQVNEIMEGDFLRLEFMRLI